LLEGDQSNHPENLKNIVTVKTLRDGEFFGETNEIMKFDGLILTDTQYTHSYVDWHYHENPYFTFLLEGKMQEGSKRNTHDCEAGTLLYHNWQDAHYNVKPDITTRGFHIELTPEWFDNFQVQRSDTEGSFIIKNPSIKLLVYRIVKEAKILDLTQSLNINELLLQVFSQMSPFKVGDDKRPIWVNKIDELLHENCTEELSLRELSDTLGIHPVHLSRDFSKHFHCTLGEYIRKLRVEKSLTLFDKRKSMTEIALDCCFSDQSHYIRCFKEYLGITPVKYRDLIGR
jgi:AraC-like DNA-binding protein